MAARFFYTTVHASLILKKNMCYIMMVACFNTSSLGVSVSSSKTVVVLLSLAVAADAGGDMVVLVV